MTIEWNDDNAFIIGIVTEYKKLKRDLSSVPKGDNELFHAATTYYNALFVLACAGLIERYLEERK